jgi:hypothetical protein
MEFFQSNLLMDTLEHLEERFEQVVERIPIAGTPFMRESL